MCIGRHVGLLDGQTWVGAGAPAGGPGAIGGQLRAFARVLLAQLLKFFGEALQLFREAVMNGGRQGAEAPNRVTSAIRGRLAIGGLWGGWGHGSFGGDVGHFLSLSQRKERENLRTTVAFIVFSYQKVQKKRSSTTMCAVRLVSSFTTHYVYWQWRT